MTTTRRLSGSLARLQVSKLCAVVVGILVGLVSSVAPDGEPVVLLTAIGLGLAVVVSLEAVAAGSRLVSTSDSAVETPTGYRAVRLFETAVALCVLGRTALWFGAQPTGTIPPDALAVFAVGMIAVSLVRTTVALKSSLAETPRVVCPEDV